MKNNHVPLKPSEVTDEVGFFDRFADRATTLVSRAPYFAACVIAVFVWAITGPLFKFGSGWQLVINTGTTIVTFLMVALLENSTRRESLAVQHKLNAIADALADFMDSQPDLADDVSELRRAVGIELKESS